MMSPHTRVEQADGASSQQPVKQQAGPLCVSDEKEHTWNLPVAS